MRNHPSIHGTLILSVMNEMVGNTIHASYVDQSTIS